MNVLVIIEVSIPPVEKNLDSLKSAASRLTNNAKSIVVQVHKKGDRFSLVTSFAMRTAAQYKVIDDIDSEFKFWTFNFEGYEEMSISFPSKSQNKSSNKFDVDDWISSDTLKF
jgi:membrane protease subunit (stomatin/prohibitin family)